MRFLPSRRWFQFRLSTWFVLVAILAWGMTMQPYSSRELETRGFPPGGSAPQGFRHVATITFAGDSSPTWMWSRPTIIVNPDLRWPAFVFVAFLLGKAARILAPRSVRDWLEFHSSTQIVVISIFAWALAMPQCSLIVSKLSDSFQPLESEQVFVPLWNRTHDEALEASQLWQKSKSDRDGGMYSSSPPTLNPRLAWPAIVLSALLAWKVAWAIGPRIVRRRQLAAAV